MWLVRVTWNAIACREATHDTAARRMRGGGALAAHPRLRLPQAERARIIFVAHVCTMCYVNAT
jgi:hypothetical protein